MTLPIQEVPLTVRTAFAEWGTTAPGADRHAASGQLGMDLGDAAVLGMPRGADGGDDVEAELVLGQGDPALPLGAERDTAARAMGVATPPDPEAKPGRAGEGGDGSLGLVGGPERPAAGGADAGGGGQFEELIGLRACGPSGHGWTAEVELPPGVTGPRTPIKDTLLP
jgi:hypothetical protein